MTLALLSLINLYDSFHYVVGRPNSPCWKWGKRCTKLQSSLYEKNKCSSGSIRLKNIQLQEGGSGQGCWNLSDQLIFNDFSAISLFQPMSQLSFNFADLRSQLFVKKTHRGFSADSYNFDNSQPFVKSHADPLRGSDDSISYEPPYHVSDIHGI